MEYIYEFIYGDNIYRIYIYFYYIYIYTFFPKFLGQILYIGSSPTTRGNCVFITNNRNTSA